MRVLTDPVEIHNARARQLRRLRRQFKEECRYQAHRFAKGARMFLIQFTLGCGFCAIWMAALVLMIVSFGWILEHCVAG